MYEYRNELISIYSLWEFARNVLARLQAERNLSRRQQEALLFFAQTINDVGALLATLPESPIGAGFKTLSVTLLCSIGRNMLDTFLSISYMLHRFTPEESSLVELVRDQFVFQTRTSIVETLNPISSALAGLKASIVERRTAIEAHHAFQGLRREIQNNAKNGFKDRIVDNEVILRYMRIVPSIFWSTNNHFSQHIHSTSYSADQLSALGNDPSEDMRFMLALLEDVQGVLSLVILTTLYGFDQPADVVPINILSILLFWQDYFRGTQEEKYER